MTTRSVIEFCAFAIGMAAIFTMFIWTCSGCLGYRPPEVPSYCRDERAYTGKLLLCVEEAKTLEQSKGCRVEVNKTCGITEVSTGGRQ